MHLAVTLVVEEDLVEAVAAVEATVVVAVTEVAEADEVVGDMTRAMVEADMVVEDLEAVVAVATERLSLLY